MYNILIITSLAWCEQVVSQASQLLRSKPLVRVAFRQSICSVISLHSGMPRAVHAAATICVHNVLRRCTWRLYLHLLIAPFWYLLWTILVSKLAMGNIFRYLDSMDSELVVTHRVSGLLVSAP